MMKYRIPSNLYNFKPTMFGIELKRLLIFFGLASVCILIIRINPLAVLLALLVIFLIMFMRVGGEPLSDLIFVNIRYLFTKKRGTITIDVYFSKHNERTLFFLSSRIYVMMLCSGTNFLELSHKDQNQLLKTVRSLLDSMDADMDVVALPESIPPTDLERNNEIDRFVVENNYSYSVMILLSFATRNDNDDKIKNHLISEGDTLISALSNNGFSASFVDDENKAFSYLSEWLG